MKIGTSSYGVEIGFRPDGNVYFGFWRLVSESSVAEVDRQRLQLNGRASRSHPIAGGMLQHTTVYETEERFKERQGYGSPRR